jgi:hypothetical protein
MKPLLVAALVVVCLMTGPAIAQEPVYPVDIKVDAVTYRFLSADMLEVSTTMTLQKWSGDPWWVESFFDVYLEVDGIPHRQPLNISSSSDVCDYDPSCSVACEIEVSGGVPVWEHCNIWTAWTGVGCDPSDPHGTCIPLEVCACGSQYILVATVPYNGEEGELYVVADPTGLVMEADETNNTCSAPLYAPEPVEPIDLQADSVLYSFPSAGMIEIMAYFTIHSSHNASAGYSSNIELFLGTNSVYSSPMSIVVPVNDCGEDPDCNNACQIEVEPGDLQWDYCSIWHSWFGAGCDPSDPTHTCIPYDYCACGSQYVVVATVPYEDEPELVFVVDGATLVHEADETNNSCSVMLAPVSTESKTWGAIKSLFHD